MTAAGTVYLAGDLAAHARGRTLAASFGAVPVDADAASLPPVGAVMVFGRQFQLQAESAHAWIEWATAPGRLLIVLPPYASESRAVPAEWEARRAEALAGGESELARILARERQYEIRGQLLPFERLAGEVVTAGWRRHPAAGLVVITSLPLWSLSVLDHQSTGQAWLADLLEQAGKVPSEPRLPPAAEEASLLRDLWPDEWTVLLHLCTGPFGSIDAALESLEISPIHHLEAARAVTVMGELEKMELSRSGKLTPRGEDVLLAGPYRAFAEALRRQNARS